MVSLKSRYCLITGLDIKTLDLVILDLTVPGGMGCAKAMTDVSGRLIKSSMKKEKSMPPHPPMEIARGNHRLTSKAVFVPVPSDLESEIIPFTDIQKKKR